MWHNFAIILSCASFIGAFVFSLPFFRSTTIALGCFFSGQICVAIAIFLENNLPTLALYSQSLFLVIQVVGIFATILLLWLRFYEMILSITSPIIASLLLARLLGEYSNASATEFSPNSFLTFHILWAIVGQVLALCSFIVSALYLWQKRSLKLKLLYQFNSKLPSLEQLEKLLIHSLWLGFVFLTVAILSGSFHYFHSFSQNQNSLLKFLWAIGVWIWYGFTLFAKHKLNIPTKRVSEMSLFGFSLLGVTFFGLLFLPWAG